MKCENNFNTFRNLSICIAHSSKLMNRLKRTASELPTSRSPKGHIPTVDRPCLVKCTSLCRRRECTDVLRPMPNRTHHSSSIHVAINHTPCETDGWPKLLPIANWPLFPGKRRGPRLLLQKTDAAAAESFSSLSFPEMALRSAVGTLVWFRAVAAAAAHIREMKS